MTGIILSKGLNPSENLGVSSFPSHPSSSFSSPSLPPPLPPSRSPGGPTT